MKPNLIKHICLLLLLAAIVNTKTSGQVKPGVFYAVTSKQSNDTSWLFGTYHLIRDSYLNETPAVLNALNIATNTVVEIIIDSAEIDGASTKAMLQNKQLKNLFDKSFVDSLDTELKATLGQGVEQMNALKPMAVMLTLSMIRQIKDNQALMEKYTGQPLDFFFVHKTKAAKKTVTALETFTQQMDLLFNRSSDEEQALMLQRFIRDKENNFRMGNELVKLYFENDLEKIYALYQQSPQSTGDMEYLLINRNKEWMKLLPSLISKQSNFIAVGALHLAGPDGLVAQLKNAGFTVTPQNLQ